MGLASSPDLHSVVEVSLSPFCHYHYSNLAKVMKDWEVGEKDFSSLVGPFLPPARKLPCGTPYHGLAHDVTKLLKGHSPCLEGRQYVPTSNNVVPSNRSLGVGFPLSVLHFCGEAGHCPPLALERLGPQDDANAVAVKQIKSLLADKSLPFGETLCVLKGDISYGKAIFLSPLYELENLVVTTRFRPGTKVWRQAPKPAVSNGGTPQVYGEKFYLTPASQSKTYRKKGQTYEVWQPSLCECAPDDQQEWPATLENGRKVTIETLRWDDMLIRTKKGATMKDKPMDIIRVRVLDEQTKQNIFQRPLFLAVCGKHKKQVDTKTAQEQYRERYGVEPTYRFAKQKMLLDKFQTPDTDHLDKWLRIVQAVMWLLFVARCEIPKFHCKPWQKYQPKNARAKQNPQMPLTPAQAQKSVQSLFYTFDKTPFLPQKSKKGKGRKKGTTFDQRKRHPVVKKLKKNAQKAKKQLNE